MKNTLIIVVVLAVVGGAAWIVKDRVQRRIDPKIRQFHSDCDDLIKGLQQYKEFFKRYPSGTTAEITKALSGQTDEKVMIIATKDSRKNDKGEVVDAWGTPIQFFFSHNAVLIRSAGPNRSFEDSRSPTCDDLY